MAGKYPGILLLENHNDVINTIIAVNSTKTAIKHRVQDRKPDGSHGRNHLQKHEFLHQHRYAEIISYQLYRHIDVINCRPDTDTALKSVNFYWAYKNAGLQSSTGFPDVTVRWGEGNEKLMCGGETLIVDQKTSRILLRRL